MRRKIQDILDDLIPLFEQRQDVDDREKVVGTPTSKQLDTEENEIEAEKEIEEKEEKLKLELRGRIPNGVQHVWNNVEWIVTEETDIYGEGNITVERNKASQTKASSADNPSNQKNL
jgi:hypothetical protein